MEHRPTPGDQRTRRRPCRFVGCQFFHYDIHHIQGLEDYGPTDINNGCCQCRRHHRMLHHQYRTEGDPNGELRFYRPDGTYIGSTYPAAVNQWRQPSHLWCPGS